MKKVVLKIGGMSCSACSSTIEKYLNRQDKVYHATVNLVMAQAYIEYDDSLSISDLEKYISESGYQSLGIYDEKEILKKEKTNKNYFIIMGILLVILMYISMGSMIGLPCFSFFNIHESPVSYSIILLLLSSLFLLYGFDIIRSGLRHMFHLRPNMDSLVSLGTIVSYVYSLYHVILICLGDYQYVSYLYFESVAMIIYFIKLGRRIDSSSREKTKEAIQGLVQITPDYAFVKVGSSEKKVSIDEVSVGDILVVRPGMKVAVDGIVVSGEGYFDETFITGESSFSKKKKGDKVIAGSIHQNGFIEYKAEAIGPNSTISEIVRLVMEATNSKTSIQRIADKISGYFVPAIMMIALCTFLGYLLCGFPLEEALVSMVTVLVVACPCALGLATPISMVVSEGVCARNGILVKSNDMLEKAAHIDTVIFDKTGTLTYGDLKISNMYRFCDMSDNDFIQLVASLEEKSMHPIRRAFLSYVEEHSLKLFHVTSFQNLDGMGITGCIHNDVIYVGNKKLLSYLKIKNKYLEEQKEIVSSRNSLIYVIKNKEVIGLVGVKDVVKEEARDVVSGLLDMGIDVVMLTGDSSNTAHLIADSVGIHEVVAEVFPKDKVRVVQKYMDEGKSIMMVGDGINDAPALATATIGVSVQTGTDIAIHSSSVVLMSQRLDKILTFMSISKNTVRNIKQNLFWAFFYNICMIPLAIGLFKPFGLSMSPMFGGIAMSISSLTVVLNALRLRKIKNSTD